MVMLAGFSSFSQENYTKHTVGKGETITKIAEQYNVKSSAIYALNPDAKKGIKFKSVLLIPSTSEKTKITSTEKPTNFPEKTHAVLPKETIYGIAKQYGVTVKELYQSNPTLEKSGLRKGQKITIPGNEFNAGTAQVAEKKTEKETAKTIDKKLTVAAENTPVAASDMVVREIQATETKYAIAKEYGITVADLDKANPILETEGLKIGQKILIPVKAEENKGTVVVVETTSVKPVVLESFEASSSR